MARLARAVAAAGCLAMVEAGAAALAATADLPTARLGVATYPTGPQPRWTTLADGPWVSGSTKPSCARQEGAPGVFVDTAGETYISGFAEVSDRYFLLKYSTDGELLWQRSFVSPYYSPIAALLLYRNSGEPRVGLVIPAEFGYSVKVFMSDGTESWSSTLAADSYREPYSASAAAFSEDGHVYVVGSRDNGTGFIARHSEGGSSDWVTEEPEMPIQRLALVGDSGVVAASSGHWSPDGVRPAILRYDAQGNRVWIRDQLEGADTQFFPGSLDVGASGEIHVAGGACEDSVCRPAIATLNADGTYRWFDRPAGLPGSEESFRSLAVGDGKLHGLIDRADSNDDFVDIVTYSETGQFLGVQTLGPFEQLASAAPMVDSLGWLRFTGRILSGGQLGYLLATLSPEAVLSWTNYSPGSVAVLGGCDLAEGPGAHLLMVGSESRAADLDIFVGSFETSGAPIWHRREPDLESPNDRAGWPGGPPRQSASALSASDGSYWVVGDSRRGQTNRTQPVGWHFSSAGALLGAVAPFGQTGYPQPVTGAVALPDGGMAMAGSTSQGVQIPFVAGYSAVHEEIFRLTDTAADRGLSRDLFRRANGELLVTEYAHSEGAWHTDVVRLSPAGVPLERVEAGASRMVPHASVFAADESVWVVGGPLDTATQDCGIAGVSPENTPLWSEFFGDAVLHDFCSSIDALDGRIVLGGQVAGAAVVKSFTTDGALEWSVEGAVEAGEAWGRIDEIVLDADGNLYLSGARIQSFETRMAKLSPAGEPLWSLPGGFLSATILRFAVAADGAVYALRQPGIGFPELYHFDGAGEVIWMSLLPQPYEAVTATADGHLILTGSTFNGHSYDLLVSVLDVAGFLFADGFESGDVTGWSGGEAVND
jgi:outer membrane protein assembly factor BamB